MAKASRPGTPDQTLLEKLKKLVVIAMFSDDALMDDLVLKGGNALDLVLRISSRASMDIDISMAHDFPGGPKALEERTSRALHVTFRDAGYAVFDLRFSERPRQLAEPLSNFWGGYAIEFKLIELDRYDQFAAQPEELRKYAIRIGNGQKFEIDISKFEYTDAKEAVDLDGYRIFVYSAAMLVFEKLRAICQQMHAYGPIIRRDRPGSPRARDFVDIHAIVNHLDIDPFSEPNKAILQAIFDAKKVPLTLLRQVGSEREFHRLGFDAVLATVRPQVKLEAFDFYFDYVLDLIRKLEPLGDV